MRRVVMGTAPAIPALLWSGSRPSRTPTQSWSSLPSRGGTYCTYRVADPKLLISDPDPTWRVISDLDPDPAHGSFRIRIGILVCEIFVKFSHFKSKCTFKGHLCAEIELFILKIMNFSFKRPDPQ